MARQMQYNINTGKGLELTLEQQANYYLVTIKGIAISIVTGTVLGNSDDAELYDETMYYTPPVNSRQTFGTYREAIAVYEQLSKQLQG